jgi:hypothetical protein
VLVERKMKQKQSKVGRQKTTPTFFLLVKYYQKVMEKKGL